MTICPYRLLPLRGGGGLRCFHLLRQLARFYDVHAVVFQRAAELRTETDGYKVPDAVRLYSPLDTPPPPTVFDRLPKRIAPGLHYRWLRRSLDGPAAAELLRSHHLIRSVLTEHRIDAVLFEHLSTMTAAPLARRLRPGVACVLDAHNVDHRLLERQMSGDSARPPSPQQSAVVDRVRRLERSLDHHVDAVWACSEDDRQEFQAHNDLPVFTIPNGVDCRAKPFDPGPTKSEGREILFCGSLTYGPNSQGLIWFLKNIWPEIRRRVPKVLLTIVGRDGSAEQFQEHLVDSSISFVGEVLDLEPYYRRASLSVCPLLMGSGTRLKILEAMSFGVPVVSTRIGAEGIGAAGGQHLLLADTPADFAEAIDRLLTDATLYELVRLAARRLVEEHYDWDVIGESARRSLEEILRNKDN